jgi:hypothetical protein
VNCLTPSGCDMDKERSKRHPFEEYLEAMEGNGPTTTLFVLLKDAGIPLLNPDDIPDGELHDVLWKVINGLWDEGVILYSTDHLSDRELYTLLWTDLLIQEQPIIPNEMPVTTHLDVLGGWGTDDMEIYLRYYADEDDRRRWATDSGKPIPEHVDPPYDRDRFLPGH